MLAQNTDLYFRCHVDGEDLATLDSLKMVASICLTYIKIYKMSMNAWNFRASTSFAKSKFISTSYSLRIFAKLISEGENRGEKVNFDSDKND